MSASLNTDHPRRVRTGGFTLIELLVVGAITTVATALLLPAVQKLRETANEQSAREYCLMLGDAVEQYYQQNGTLPGEIAAESEFWGLMAAAGGSSVDDRGTIAFAGYEFEYVADAGVYSIGCKPVAPGLTGSVTWTLFGQAGVEPNPADLVSSVTDQADENRERALAAIRKDAAQVIAGMYDNPNLDAAGTSVESLPEGDLTFFAYDRMDVNGDGQISIAELSSDQHSVLPRQLTASIRDNLQLGAGNESVSTIPAVVPEDLQSDASQ